MNNIKLIGDMNISPETIAYLQERGWNIIRVSEVLPANTSDQEILDFAKKNNRVIITQDLDFSMLIALQGYQQPSLITLRLSSSNIDFVNQKLLEVLNLWQDQINQGIALTVEDQKIRLRNLPIK